MADRSIVIKLKANVAEFKKGMVEASKATKGAKDEMEAATTKQQAWGRAVTEHSTEIIGLGVALEEVARRGIKKWADYDEAMSAVASSGADARDNIEALNEAALQFGADTQYNAVECANAINELAKAGLDASDILSGALAGSLDLAASENMAVAEAAAITATALQQFHLEGSKAVWVADLLAAGAGKAMGSAHDLGEALGNAGLMANQMGVGIDETVGTLAAFAQYGLLGAEAGTAMKSMLLAMVDPSTKAQNVMDELGIEFYNANGQFIGMTTLAGELQDKLAGLTDQQRDQAMATIFGSYAIRAANVLYNEGAEGIAKWVREVDDWGYAAEAARTKTDNLKGDLERLGGTFETIMIQSGSGLNGMLRNLVQVTDELLGKFGSLPTPMLAIGMGLTGLTGIALVGIGTIGKLAKTLIELRDAHLITEAAAGSLGAKLGQLGKFAAGAIVAIAAVQAEGTLLDKWSHAGENLPSEGKLLNFAQDYTKQLDKLNSAQDIAIARSGFLNQMFSVQLSEYHDTFSAIAGTSKQFTHSLSDFAMQSYAAEHGLLGFGNALTGLYATSNAELFNKHLTTVNQTLGEMVNRGYGSEVALLIRDIRSEFSQWSDDEFEAKFAPTIDALEHQRQILEELQGTFKAHSTSSFIEQTTRAAQVLASLGDDADKVTKKLFEMGLSTEEAAELVLQFGAEAPEVFKSFADHFAQAATSVSNGAAAWDKARGKAEKPPSMKAWIKALEDQARAFTKYRENVEGVSKRIRDELPADAQQAAEAMLNAFANNPQAIAMLMNSTADELATAVDAWGRTGESVGVAWSKGFAKETLAGAHLFESVLATIDGRAVTVWLNGEPMPFNQMADAAIMRVDQSTGTVTIEGKYGNLIETVNDAKIEVDDTTGEMTISGKDRELRDIAFTVKNNIEETIITPKLDLDPKLANSAYGDIKTMIEGNTLTIPVTLGPLTGSLPQAAIPKATTSLPGITPKSIAPVKRAAGGPIKGGVPGQDSVPSMLMPDEHVWTVAEVAAVGGHDAMFALRAAALAGQLQMFANGGPVQFSSAPTPVYHPVSFTAPAPTASPSQPFDAGALASAMTGMKFELIIDGQPIKAIAQASVFPALNSQLVAARRGGKYA